MGEAVPVALPLMEAVEVAVNDEVLLVVTEVVRVTEAVAVAELDCDTVPVADPEGDTVAVTVCDTDTLTDAVPVGVLDDVGVAVTEEVGVTDVVATTDAETEADGVEVGLVVAVTDAVLLMLGDGSTLLDATVTTFCREVTSLRVEPRVGPYTLMSVPNTDGTMLGPFMDVATEKAKDVLATSVPGMLVMMA